jgi:hypothetical protein
MMKLVKAVIALVLVPLLARGENLMLCPDCEKMVSKRALMCPNCGCKGEVIAEESARLAKAEEPPPPDDAILADFGDRKERATLDIRRLTTGWRHSTTDSRLLSVERLPAVGRRKSNVALTQNII